MNLKSLIGNKIHDLRILHHFSQKELAEKAQISPNYLRAIEKGNANITIDLLEQIVLFFGLSLPSFFSSLADTNNLSSSQPDAFIDHRLFTSLYPLSPPYPYHVCPAHNLLQFIMYLPLINPVDLYEALSRIGGSIIGYEGYILSQLSNAIQKIPPSPAKTFADEYCRSLDDYREYMASHDFSGEKYLCDLPSGYEKYREKIEKTKNFLQFFKIFVQMQKETNYLGLNNVYGKKQPDISAEEKGKT